MILFGLFLTNCQKKSEYESMVQSGLNSGVTNNDLFLVYELGMTRKDFYEKSWELNKEMVVTGLVKIEYTFTDLKSRATMRFYPDFVEDRISNVPVDVHYEGWAPWNKELSSDSLVVDLVSYFHENLNTDFDNVYVQHLEKNAYVSVDGNREIIIYPLTEMVARVDFTDLKVVERINN